VAWIPGYWGWDDEPERLPLASAAPGARCHAGTGPREWKPVTGGTPDTATSGFPAIGADGRPQQRPTYLPPPPATLEIGANLDAPSDDYGWTPGCLDLAAGALRVGAPVTGRKAGGTGSGFPPIMCGLRGASFFVEGFWITRWNGAGMLFRAALYYRSHDYARRGYSYSPRIVDQPRDLQRLSLPAAQLPPLLHSGITTTQRYEQGGFYASFSYQSQPLGLRSFYSHDRWEHRQDRDWDNRFSGILPISSRERGRTPAAHLGRPADDQYEAGAIRADPHRDGRAHRPAGRPQGQPGAIPAG